MRGHGQVEVLHQLDEGRAIPGLQARVGRDLIADGRRTAAFVVVGRVDQGLRRQLEQLAEQAVEQLIGIAGGQVAVKGPKGELKFVLDGERLKLTTTGGVLVFDGTPRAAR